jgi:hypothetical protein
LESCAWNAIGSGVGRTQRALASACLFRRLCSSSHFGCAGSVRRVDSGGGLSVAGGAKS